MFNDALPLAFHVLLFSTLLFSSVPGTGPGLSMVKIIAFGAGAFVALVIIVTIVCFVTKKKNRKRQAGKSIHSVTMFYTDYNES